MGYTSRWQPSDWDTYKTAATQKTVDELYSSTKISESLDPTKFNLRESRDSAINPNSTPIIVGIDVTGSMSHIADYLGKQGLGDFFSETLKRKPVEDPHLMFMAIGDVKCDQAPLQVSQFECDSRIIEQLTSIYLERGGGGNGSESYTLPWYYAAKHTAVDSFEKRNKKGYLFTCGDDGCPPTLSSAEISRALNKQDSNNYTAQELLKLVEDKYHVFHIDVRGQSGGNWPSILGSNFISLDNYKYLAQTIVSIIEATEGKDLVDVCNSWPTEAEKASVSRALKNLKTKVATASGGVVRF
jgi:hypothetical protein